MAKRTLKMPDGGKLDLPIPDGFGAPVVAFNDGATAVAKPWTIAAVVLGAAALYSLWRALK
jgi:hypothetical protein